MKILWEEKVFHLSPAGIRVEMESLIEKVGKLAADASWLHSRRPELYWGTIWYSNRVHLPSGFYLSGSAVDKTASLDDFGLVAGQYIGADSKEDNNKVDSLWELGHGVIVGYGEEATKCVASRLMQEEEADKPNTKGEVSFGLHLKKMFCRRIIYYFHFSNNSTIFPMIKV